MPVKLIADACCNHLGDPLIAQEMIKVASELEVDYIKFQLYDADFINKAIYTRDYISFMRSSQVFYSDVLEIIELCYKYKIEPMFTVFHYDRIHLLDNDKLMYTWPVVKIASCDAMKPWVYDIVKKVSPQNVIISLGMCSASEKADIITKYKDFPNVKFLSCVSQYPCRMKDLDFFEAKKLNGLSCHTNEEEALRLAVDMDLEYLEFHYTLGHYLPGKDQKFAVDPEQLEDLVNYRRYKSNVERYKNRFIERPKTGG